MLYSLFNFDSLKCPVLSYRCKSNCGDEATLENYLYEFTVYILVDVWFGSLSSATEHHCALLANGHVGEGRLLCSSPPPMSSFLFLLPSSHSCLPLLHFSLPPLPSPLPAFVVEFSRTEAQRVGMWGQATLPWLGSEGGWGVAAPNLSNVDLTHGHIDPWARAQKCPSWSLWVMVTGLFLENSYKYVASLRLTSYHLSAFPPESDKPVKRRGQMQVVNGASGKVSGLRCFWDSPPRLSRGKTEPTGLGTRGSLKPSFVQFCLELVLHFVTHLLSRRTLGWLVGRSLRIFCRLNLP